MLLYGVRRLADPNVMMMMMVVVDPFGWVVSKSGPVRSVPNPKGDGNPMKSVTVVAVGAGEHCQILLCFY